MTQRIKLVAQVCMYNEIEKGNLERFLDNVSRYCDDIVIWDDGSTDNSVEVASHRTTHILRGDTNDQMNELAHKQAILTRSLQIGATHLFWLDCDEVLDRDGTLGGIRDLCQHWPDGVDAFSFKEINFWRSDCWVRTDTLFDRGSFVRLWKVVPNIRFDVRNGVHLRLYPSTIQSISPAPFSVLHYGFHDYRRMMEKIGAHTFTREELHSRAPSNWILDERDCTCHLASDVLYPPGCESEKNSPKPEKKATEDLIPYSDVSTLEGERVSQLIDQKQTERWRLRHQRGYHGKFEDIHVRNTGVWTHEEDTWTPQLFHMFHFDPAGKVVFDVGAGGGWYALECIRAGAKKVYCLEIDARLIKQAERSFRELGVPEEAYQFVNISDEEASAALPTADIIYCLTVFQHIPYRLVEGYFRWIACKLSSGGEAHLQLHRLDGLTTFLDSRERVSIENVGVSLERAGLCVVGSPRLVEGENIKPVWWIYVCSRIG